MTMEVNEKCEIVKYSKLVEGKAQKDIGASSTQEEMDNYQTVEISASTGIEENDDLFNVKPKQQKIGSKHLIGLSLAFLVIVSGLIAGLIVVSMSNHKLELQNHDFLKLPKQDDTKGTDDILFTLCNLSVTKLALSLELLSSMMSTLALKN